MAGQTGQHCAAATDACGDGGPAGEAHLGTTAGLAVGLDGALYLADPALHRVRVVDPVAPRVITTVAGNGEKCSDQHSACGDGGSARNASLNGPYGVWVDPSGLIFIADGDHGVREVHPDGTITPVGAAAYDVRGIVGGTGGNLYATTNDPAYLLKIHLADGSVTKVVGTGTSGYNGNTDPNTGLLLPGNQVRSTIPKACRWGLTVMWCLPTPATISSAPTCRAPTTLSTWEAWSRPLVTRREASMATAISPTRPSSTAPRTLPRPAERCSWSQTRKTTGSASSGQSRCRRVRAAGERLEAYERDRVFMPYRSRREKRA